MQGQYLCNSSWSESVCSDPLRLAENMNEWGRIKVTGGLSVLAVGNSHWVVSKGVCSESTRVMSCLVVLFLLNTLQSRRKKRMEPLIPTASSQESTKKKISCNVRHSYKNNAITLIQWFLWLQLGEAQQWDDAFTAHTTHINTNSILWGSSVRVHWSQWG